LRNARIDDSSYNTRPATRRQRKGWSGNVRQLVKQAFERLMMPAVSVSLRNASSGNSLTENFGGGGTPRKRLRAGGYFLTGPTGRGGRSRGTPGTGAVTVPDIGVRIGSAVWVAAGSVLSGRALWMRLRFVFR